MAKSQSEDRVAGLSNEKKRPRDVFFALLLVLFWLGWAVIGYFALSEGRVELVTNGIDSYGFLCGAVSSEQTSNDQLASADNMVTTGNLSYSLPDLSFR